MTLWPTRPHDAALLSSPAPPHLPSSTDTTGTSGCLNNRNASCPRPAQLRSASSRDTRLWLPLASEVMMATGVFTCLPVSWKYRYSRACEDKDIEN